MIRRLAIVAGCVVVLLSGAAAERHRDPLTTAEVDQLRDTAQEPEKRLKLYVDFIRIRLNDVAQTGSDPKVTDKAQAIHDRLQDFLDLYDELNDNIDVYADRKYDIRKALKMILEADTEFQSKLQAVKSSSSATPAQAKTYDFVLTNAIDSVTEGGKDHEDLLNEQQELAKHKQLTKPEQQQGPVKPH